MENLKIQLEFIFSKCNKPLFTQMCASLLQVWVFEPCQLIRVILSRPPEEVNREKDEIILELSNATQSRVVVDDIRYHVDSSGHIRREWYVQIFIQLFFSLCIIFIIYNLS